MMFIILRALFFNCIGIAFVDCCILKRDQHNEYPWMIKIYWGRTWGHGSLTAPNRVLSAYEPFKSKFSQVLQLYGHLEFIGQNRGGDGGKGRCTAVRKSNSTRRHVEATGRNVLFWELSESFEIGYNLPFLFATIVDLSKDVIANDLKKSDKHETCYVPLFEAERAKYDLGITVDEVKLTEWVECKKKFPAETRITQEEFCGAQHPHIYEYATWLQGAVILCRNKPVGTISAVRGVQPPETFGLTVFVSLAYSAKVLRGQVKFWPSRLTTTTATTEATTTTTTEATTATTAQRAETSAGFAYNETTAEADDTDTDDDDTDTEEDDTDTEETVQGPTTAATMMTSKVPQAPDMTHPPPTTEFDGRFVASPRIRAKYLTERRVNSSMPPRSNRPLMAFSLCTIVLQRLHPKYISYA